MDPDTGINAATDAGMNSGTGTGTDTGIASAPPAKDEITTDAFFAVDMRVGRVVDVRDFPEARKPAWKVSVDFGPLGERHTSAQVTNYRREELLGRRVVGAVNLGVKRIAGFRSEFLLLGAVDADGTVHLLAPDAGEPGDPVA